MLSDTFSIRPAILGVNQDPLAGSPDHLSAYSLRDHMRGLWLRVQPTRPLTTSEWADLRRKLAPCRPPRPAPLFAPKTTLFSS